MALKRPLPPSRAAGAPAFRPSEKRPRYDFAGADAGPRDLRAALRELARSAGPPPPRMRSPGMRPPRRSPGRWRSPPRASGGRLPPAGSRLLGNVHRYNPDHAFGFIRSPETGEEDIYFRRSALPPEAQSRHRGSLAGTKVEFELQITPDKKLRTDRIWLLSPLDRDRPRDRGRRGGAGERDGPPPAPLDEETIDEMVRFLESKGGVMDHGKFANAFPRVKKSQLETHFVLVQAGSTSGGRWQVTLPGVEPLTPEEQEARERAEAEEAEAGEPLQEEEASEVGPLHLEPSAALRLIGRVEKWDRKRGCGIVATEGAGDAIVHRSDLPPELQGWKGNFAGAEVTFVLSETEEGKLKAADVHMLLMPGEDGGWRLRRADIDVGQGVQEGEELVHEEVDEEEEVVEEPEQDEEAVADEEAAEGGDPNEEVVET